MRLKTTRDRFTALAWWRLVETAAQRWVLIGSSLALVLCLRTLWYGVIDHGPGEDEALMEQIRFFVAALTCLLSAESTRRIAQVAGALRSAAGGTQVAIGRKPLIVLGLSGLVALGGAVTLGSISDLPLIIIVGLYVIAAVSILMVPAARAVANERQ